MTPSTTELGQHGEGLAVRFLRQQGYRIVAQNHRCRGGEIDIVAEDRTGVLCFVEVRSRQSRAFGDPLETVDRKKQRRLIRAARHYLTRFDRHDSECRFDVIGIVYRPELAIELVAGAFELDAGDPW